MKVSIPYYPPHSQKGHTECNSDGGPECHKPVTEVVPRIRAVRMMVPSEDFYGTEIDGTSVADWVDSLLTGTIEHVGPSIK